MKFKFALLGETCCRNLKQIHMHSPLHLVLYVRIVPWKNWQRFFAAYSTGTASNMKSPPKRPNVTSDNYQVSWSNDDVKNTVHIIRANVWSIANQFSHRRAAIRATGRLPCRRRRHAAAVRRRFRSATSSMVVRKTRSCMTPRKYTGFRSGLISATVCRVGQPVFQTREVPWRHERGALAGWQLSGWKIL